jgi:hypothetical protein
MKDIIQAGFGIEVPRWVVMWVVAGVMFGVGKGLTLLERRRRSGFLPVGRTAAYLLLWVGMDVRGFFAKGEAARGWVEAVPGLFKVTLGAVLLWGVAPLFDGLAAGWVGMAGMVLMLHFGLFHLLAVFWARLGVAVEPIMNRPLQARTLAEFWGERWNRAFNELMYRFIFRRTLRWAGPAGAVLVVFVASGLIHDVAISVPAGAGYGWPTIYFLVQGIGLLIQRTSAARRAGWSSGWKGRIFTGLVLVGPLPLLFHAAFIERVILPFMEVIGAGPALQTGEVL